MPRLPPTLLSSVIVKAMSHPTRVKAMAVLFDRDATPSEIAAELGEPLNNVGYHLEVLRELDCIELIEVRPVHGGRVAEHVYRTTRRAHVDGEAWKQFGEKEKIQVTTTIMQLSSEDVSEAMIAKTFFDPDDNHLSRTPMQVDIEGWEETTALLDETLERLFEIETRVASRLAKGAETMPMRVMMFQFRAPRPGY